MANAISKRGFIYALAIAFNKIVPATLFRFGIMEISRLSNDKLSQLPSTQQTQTKRINNPAQRRELKSVTKNGLADSVTHSHRAFGIVQSHSDTLVGGLWVAQDQFLETSLNTRFLISPKQSWIYCAYVENQAREQGNYSSCLKFVADAAANDENRELLVAYNPFNKASAKAHRNLKAEKLGTLYSICIFRLTFACCTGKIKRSKMFGSPKNPIDVSLGS